MCRLLYLPRNVRPSLRQLTGWLEMLEKSKGGDGNGYATIRKGVRKGVKLTASECAEDIARLRAPVVWHTRLVSCGMKCDSLCHPFNTSRGWLVHNGHWHEGAVAAKLLKGRWNDTAAAALWIKIYGWNSFTKQCDQGVWLHLTKGGLQVHYASGTLYVEEETGALCSRPCTFWGSWSPAECGTYGVDDEVPVEQPDTSVEDEEAFEYEDSAEGLTWNTGNVPVPKQTSYLDLIKGRGLYQ